MTSGYDPRNPLMPGSLEGDTQWDSGAHAMPRIILVDLTLDQARVLSFEHLLGAHFIFFYL